MTAALIGATLLFGCASYQAVTATSKLGEMLAEQAPQMRVIDESCLFLRALKEAQRCPKRSGQWSRALEMLVSYSRELGMLAAGRAQSVGDDVNRVLDQTAPWTRLSKDQNKDVAAVANGVMVLLTREASRKSLQQAIRDIDPPLGEVVNLILAQLQLEQEHLRLLRCALACKAGSPLDVVTCPQTPAETCRADDDGRALWFATLLIDIERKDQAVSEAQKKLAAFGKAHHALYENVTQLDSDVVLKAVLDDVQAAMKPN